MYVQTYTRVAARYTASAVFPIRCTNLKKKINQLLRHKEFFEIKILRLALRRRFKIKQNIGSYDHTVSVAKITRH